VADEHRSETYVLPDAGEGTATEVRTYDESKRLKEVQRPDGKLITFAFKPASDRLESTSPRGVTSFSYHPINGMKTD